LVGHAKFTFWANNRKQVLDLHGGSYTRFGSNVTHAVDNMDSVRVNLTIRSMDHDAVHPQSASYMPEQQRQYAYRKLLSHVASLLALLPAYATLDPAVMGCPCHADCTKTLPARVYYTPGNYTWRSCTGSGCHAVTRQTS